MSEKTEMVIVGFSELIVCTMVLRVQWVLYCNVLTPEEAPGDYGSTILFFSHVPCYKKHIFVL